MDSNDAEDNPKCYVKDVFRCLDSACYQEGRNLCEELGASVVLGIKDEAPLNTEVFTICTMTVVT
jgi:hypothetical protein